LITQLEITTSGVGQWYCFDVAFEEFDVGDAGLGAVVAGEAEHLVGHVEAVGGSGRPDPAGGEQDVGAASRPSRGRPRSRFVQIGDGEGVTAAEADGDRIGTSPCIRVVIGSGQISASIPGRVHRLR
jgi:hypothetical protein